MDLEELVAQALRTGEWAPVLVEVDDYFGELSTSTGAASRFIGRIAPVIERTEYRPEDPDQVRRITDWLYTSTQSAAMVANNRGGALVWRTQDDDRVRPAHAALNGATVAAGGTFDVEGEALHFPGEPIGDPSGWYNCRCYLQVAEQSLAAALSPVEPGEIDSSVIVLLPSPGDPVNALGPEESHLSLVFLGDQEVGEQARIAIAQYATALSPQIDIGVTGVDAFGPEDEQDKAQVLTLDTEVASQIRDGLLAVLAEHGLQDASDWPDYRPHLTLGYDDPANFEEPQTPEAIGFDRLALWTPKGRQEVPLGDQLPPSGEVEDEDDFEVPEPTQFHATLTPEGVWTGDGRKFALNSLTWAPLPFPMSYQKISAGGHEGSLVVAKHDTVWREADEDRNRIEAEGEFADTPEADEAIGMIAQGFVRGISVDLDSAVGIGEMFTFAGSDEPIEGTSYSTGRIRSSHILAIPAFVEGEIAVGPLRIEQTIAASGAPAQPFITGSIALGPLGGVQASAEPVQTFVSEEPWDGSASRFTPEQWKRSTILHVCDDGDPKDETQPKDCHKLPIREPGGALSRAGVHAAAARINQVDATPAQIAKAKASLRTAYRELDEDAPDVIKASALIVDDFKRGPGWITNPKETRTLHRYWTTPGQPGYNKIGWGTPNDFYRCRAHLAKYVPLRYLNRTCAEWHHDALGYWPGEHLGGTMTAAAALPQTYRPPAAWFTDPHLPMRTPLTITEEGKIFGHLASWDQCHVSFGEAAGRCVIAPHSATDYSYFQLGKVLADEGEVRVGQIVLGGGHARDGVNLGVAQDHYANTTRAVADIATGEDRIGIWFSGAVRPWISSEDLYALRAAKLSGDWRRVHGNLELMAALAVNIPGFPVPETSLTASADGEILSLTAAAVVIDPEPPSDNPELVAIAERAARKVMAEAQASAERVKAAREARSEFRLQRAAQVKREWEKF